jgi:hypothetical protein
MASPHLSGKKVSIPEDRVKWDFEQHDRYQAYSSELMKLALGGLAVVGFLLTLFLKDAPASFPQLKANEPFWSAIKWGAFFLACSTGAALLHKYLAADGMHHHLRAIKFLIWAEEHPEEDGCAPWTREVWTAEIESDQRKRNERFLLSGYALNVSAIFFGLGVILIAGSLWLVAPAAALK